jgi:hypothetical protein
MREILETAGWVMYYNCNTCGGNKQYFNNLSKPGYEIRTRPKNNTFSVVLNNRIVAGPFWGYQLEQKITEYVP